MQQILVTQYVIAGEPYGFPGDTLVFDDEARAATVEALLERAKSSGLLALVCSSLDKLGRDSSATSAATGPTATIPFRRW